MDIERELLLAVSAAGDNGVDSEVLATELKVEHQALVGAMKSLMSKSMLVSTQRERSILGLSAEGTKVLENGSPEVRVFNSIPEDGITMKELSDAIGEIAKIGFAQGMKSKWFRMDKSQGGKVFKSVDTVSDAHRNALQRLHSGEELGSKEVNDLKKRRMVEVTTTKSFTIKKGPEFALEVKQQETDLTAEMLTSGAWKEASFKQYNFNAQGKTMASGHLHPLLKVRSQFREVFFELGFAEMKTDRWVESSFWNFDALFQPQQHPARDAHDTFFLKDPAEAVSLPKEYLEAVRDVHQDGGYGSIGYRYDWKIEEAKKNLLRTHTTAVSSRTLKDLADELAAGKPFRPRKFFSIDRVFRNEEMDATHLCEFHQVEGMVIDRNLTLGNLIALFSTFFEKIGIRNLRFKPAYNPYTEPSMEIFGYHPILKRWTELGNSGIFRPEMLRPMGLPEDVRVLAWGLSLERPTMILYRISNIRDLIGFKVDFHMIENNPICRLDKKSDAVDDEDAMETTA